MKLFFTRLLIYMTKLTLYGLCIQGLLFSTLLAFDGNAQKAESVHEVRLNVNFKNASFEEILSHIQIETDYVFSYDKEDFRNQKIKFSMKASQIGLAELLTEVSKTAHVGFKQINNNIYIKKLNNRQKSGLEVVMQSVTITGKVTSADDNEPLPGVNVLLKDTSLGTVTDIDGNYTLEVPEEGGVLIYSYVGYIKEELVINGRSVIDVSMVPDIQALDEIVVIGYGTSQKKDVIGAVDQIESSIIEGRPVSNLTQALQGVSANLIVQQRSANPNDNILSINIRGVSTMNNNEPLVVIDGLITELESLNKLNPDDIENISILKDAGSAAIYGSRSANGVILVTTKKGVKNQAPVVRFSSLVGVEQPNVLFKPVKGYENAILKNQALINGGSAPVYTPEEIRDLQENGDGEWFLDGILQDAFQQDYNLSVSGGANNTTYLVSAGYYNQESNFVGDYGLERFNFRTNLVNEYDRMKISTIMAFNRIKQNAPQAHPGTLIVDGSRIPNYYTYRMKTDDGRYLINDVLSEFNPLGLLEAGGFQKKDEDNFVGSINAEFEIIDGLKAIGLLGIDLSANHRYIRSLEVPFYASESAIEPSSYANSTRTTEDYNEKKYTLNSRFLLDYDKVFSELHHITGMVGVSNESYTREANELKKKYTDRDLGMPDSETEIDTESYNTPAQTQQRSIYSLFGRLGYTYDFKYYASVSFRYDGSSKFAEDYRWGFFPSVSAGWRLSEESFLSSYKSNVGELKIRGSYGVLGNQNVDDYSYFTTYTVYNNIYGFNNNALSGTGFTFGNRELEWERSKTLNIGLDATFFQNKLTVNLDFFNKVTSEILLTPEVPTVFGGAVAKDNSGKMRNYGWDLTLGYRANTGDFIHNVSLNLGDSQNEVTGFTGGEEISSADQMLRITREGLPFRSYFGYKVDGYFQSYDEIENSALPVGTTVDPGDVKYVDTNEDGIIDEEDRQVLGNAFPRYSFGISYNVAWKNFDFGCLIQGVGKRDMFLRGELVEPFHSNYSYVMYTHQLNYWTPTNTDARWPRLSSPGSSSNTNNFQKSSDIYIFNASYLRLKNIQLGYTLPEEITSKLGIEKLRININAQNLLTLSNVSFIDPESTEFNGNMSNGGANSGRNYPTLIFYGCGIDVQF
ncbi:MAG: SusC/RagA family TonB-linked outer membrane protein [Cytophagales bacterium]|nr:SusC/RagA family TonB-linked outer membrane protein [Cytophagales bacterium]